MILRNKKTGKIITSKELLTDEFIIDLFSRDFDYFNSRLHKIEDEWEDYEETKEHWFIDYDGGIVPFNINKETATDIMMKQIGNYFETKEEAEQAVEKLKAWKRLKDKGFRFSKDWVYRYDQPFVKNHTYFEFVAICEDGILFDNLDLLFGGGDETIN